jgi:hypothetical protein
MKSIVFAGLVATALASVEVPERGRGGEVWKRLQQKKALKADSTCETTFWDAQIDHSEGGDSEGTYKQRYFVDAKDYTEGGPIFLNIGGEGTASCPGGYVTTLAPEYGAMAVTLEHRFYGESVPNGNWDTENLQFLTVENALADLSTFTTWFRESRNMTDTKVFVFGGSYPGALASWYRMAYPDSSVGSLSSSGVVNPIVDFVAFDEKVAQAAGNKCADRIRDTTAAFERTIATGNSGWEASLDQFYCEKTMSENDFYYMTADSFSMAVQYGHKTDLCAALEAVPAGADDATITQAFADFSNAYWGKDFCSMGFYDTSALADPLRWDGNSRSWRWQTCYQVAWFNTAPKSGSLRAASVDLNYHLSQCKAIFGQGMFPKVNGLWQSFGGAYPTAHNTFYSDFSDDPWSPASVTYPVSSDQPFVYATADDLGHCSDLHTPADTDSQALKNCRAEFEGYLAAWLA